MGNIKNTEIQMTSNVDVETIDPLESLGEFSIDEMGILESIDPNDLTEWIEDASDSVNEEQDTKSIDPDDLKEWLEVMSCEGDSELLGDLLQDGTKRWEECSDSDYESDGTAPKIDFFNNMTVPKIDHNTVLQERIVEYQKKLELTMFRTELSRQQFLKKKLVATTMPSTESIEPSVLNNLNDLVTGKRKYLTSNLEESRKRLKMFKSQPSQQNAMQRYHNDFFTGRRTALTSELEESRNYLKMLGGLNKAQSPRTRLVDGSWSSQNKSNSALMA